MDANYNRIGGLRAEWRALSSRADICTLRERLVHRYMDEFLRAALVEAQKGHAAGGIPIGSVLVIDGTIVGRGHNQRVQKSSAVLHAEMDCLENAGRLQPSDYRRATLYSTLSPFYAGASRIVERGYWRSKVKTGNRYHFFFANFAKPLRTLRLQMNQEA